jgi:hypothetical protein
MKNEDQLEESICDTCTAGMCDMCSKRHTSSSYQLNKNEAGEYYSNLEKKNTIVKKEYNSNEMKVGDIIQYQYDSTSCARTVEAEVTYIDDRTKAYYVRYKGRYYEFIEERAKTFL